jgi:nucleoside-diphosphate-sugar epimerase
MKLLIIGANGFLGGALYRYYQAKKDEVLTFSYRSNNHKDCIDKIESLIKTEQFDLIINAGASQNGKDNPEALTELINSNVLFPAIIASFIKEHSINTSLIQFGTSWQIDENGKNSPFNAYASSKSSAESFLDHYAQDGVKVATLRLYETYGPHDKRTKIINLIIDSLIHQKELEMTGGEQIANFIYIDDVIRAVELTYEFLAKETKGMHYIFNVKTNDNYSVKDILNILKNLLGIKEVNFIKLGKREYRERERFKLFDDVLKIPGWKAKPLEENLKKTIEYRKTIKYDL